MGGWYFVAFVESLWFARKNSLNADTTSEAPIPDVIRLDSLILICGLGAHPDKAAASVNAIEKGIRFSMSCAILGSGPESQS